MPRNALPIALLLLATFLIHAPSTAAPAARGMTLDHLATLRTVGEVVISPDGTRVAYTLHVPRVPGAGEDGPSWTELHLVFADGGPATPYVHGEVDVSKIRFTPDGSLITYLAEREGDKQRSLWAIPVHGGESRRLIAFEEDIEDYRVSPDGTRVAFLATEPMPEARREAREKGFDQEIFEEDWRHSMVWIAPLPGLDDTPPAAATGGDKQEEKAPRALPLEGSAFKLDWSPDGRRLALAVAPRPLIDDEYMLSRIQVVDVKSGAVLARLPNPGKLGNFAFSPDGTRIALLSAADENDPAAGRLMVAPAGSGPLQDVLPGLLGHVGALAWRDAGTLAFMADIGVSTVYGEVDLATGTRIDRYVGGGTEPSHRHASGEAVFTSLSLSRDGRHAAFSGNAWNHPAEAFAYTPQDRSPRRLTDSNPWLGEVAMARQEVVRYPARDGLEIEGILVHPLEPAADKPHPLILLVHGGPEGHLRNGWVTRYFRPGQIGAARGYAVFYPNYRGSTGRGVVYSKLGQGDAAGREFDDLVDAVDHLVARGIADRDRVGVTGGSYGGYATAWLATRYTEQFKAGVMFVGISNKITKGLTTEIPLEDMMVHTLFPPWTRWHYSLERSPIYHVERCRTALLIVGGDADLRVNPEQSLQLYRALRLIGKTPVRYVRYPGEEHGNRRAAARYDYGHRYLRWFDHYLKGPGGDPPPWDLGLGEDEDEWEEETEEEGAAAEAP